MSLPQIILISHSHVLVSVGFCVEQGSIGNVTGELLSSEFIWHMVNRIKIAIENMANLPSFLFVLLVSVPPPPQNIQQQTEKICFVNPQAIFQAGSGEGANERVLSSLRVYNKLCYPGISPILLSFPSIQCEMFSSSPESTPCTWKDKRKSKDQTDLM